VAKSVNKDNGGHTVQKDAKTGQYTSNIPNKTDYKVIGYTEKRGAPTKEDLKRER
jgi:hypothetical protein